MKLKLLALLSLLAAPALALADWQGTNWGMQPDEVVNQSNGMAELYAGKQGNSTANLAKGTFETRGIVFTVFYHFGLEKKDLALIELLAQSPSFSQCNTLRTSMLDVYGPPEQTGGVAIIKLTTYQWRDQSKANRVLLATSENPVMCSIQYTPLATKASLGL